MHYHRITHLNRQAFLVHQSAYDEMCGGPEKVDNTLSLAVHCSNTGK